MENAIFTATFRYLHVIHVQDYRIQAEQILSFLTKKKKKKKPQDHVNHFGPTFGTILKVVLWKQNKTTQHNTTQHNTTQHKTKQL